MFGGKLNLIYELRAGVRVRGWGIGNKTEIVGEHEYFICFGSVAAQKVHQSGRRLKSSSLFLPQLFDHQPLPSRKQFTVEIVNKIIKYCIYGQSNGQGNAKGAGELFTAGV